MVAPTISSMPAAPSRVGDPSNFYAESLAFLAAQDTLSGDLNAVSAYFNAALYSTDNWGSISDVPSGGTAALIDDLPAGLPVGTGLQYVTGMDALLASLQPFITDANAVASSLDGFIDAAGQSDPLAPPLVAVAQSPERTDSMGGFNSKAPSFYVGLGSWAKSVNQLSAYVTQALSGFEDWGLVSQSITDTEDFGGL